MAPDDRQATSGGRALLVVALLLVGVLVALFVLSRASQPDAVERAGGAATKPSNHRDPFARVSGGDQDPDVDVAELVLALRGHVIDSDRRPVADAEVEILYRPAGIVRSDKPSAIVRTDANGDFVIAQLRAASYRLEARKDDAVSATIDVELSARSAPVTLILVPAATLNVRVVSAQDDRPIANALVRVAPGNSDLGPVEVVREARTDATGVARIRGLNPVSNHGVYAEATGYAGATTNVLAGANPERQAWAAVIRLHAGGVVVGRVLDKQGRPVAGASLRWYTGEAAKDADQVPGLFSTHQGVVRMSTVRSGSDGRFRMPAGVGPGVLEAAHPSHRLGFARGVVVAGGELALDVVVEGGAKLAGVVLDAAGNPVAGAEVIATKPGLSHQQMFMDMYRFRATTDRFGEFAFAGLDRDELSLAAWSAEGASELVHVDLRATAEQTGVVIELTRTGQITGVVLDGDGKPAPHAQVTFFVATQTVTPPAGVTLEAAMPALIANPRSQGVVIAGEDGRFVITGLVDGEYQLTARRSKALSVAPVFGEARLDKIRPGQDVKLSLPGVGSLSGRIVADGGALTGLTVAAAGWQKDTSYPPGRAVSGDGRFKLAEVPAGRYGIKVSGGNVIDWASAEGYDVVAGRDTDVGTIHVTRGVPARDGVVVDSAGAPVVAAQVTMQLAIGGAMRNVEDVTDDRGAFTVPAVPYGSAVRLRAYTRDITSEWQTIGPDVSDVKIVFAAGSTGAIAGLVVKGGEPAEKRTVMLTLDSVVTDPNTAKSRGHTVTEAGGSFRFKDVPLGQYRLWVRRADDVANPRAPEWTAHPEPIIIQPGKEVTVVVQVAQ